MLVEFLCTEHIDYALETGLAGEYSYFLSISSPWPFCAHDLCCALLIGLVQDVLVKLNLVCVFGGRHLMASEV